MSGRVKNVCSASVCEKMCVWKYKNALNAGLHWWTRLLCYVHSQSWIEFREGSQVSNAVTPSLKLELFVSKVTRVLLRGLILFIPFCRNKSCIGFDMMPKTKTSVLCDMCLAGRHFLHVPWAGAICS